MAPPVTAPHLLDPANEVSQVTSDIVCVSCPVPFDVGSVNAYVLLGDPLTLVDTGSRIGFDIDDLAALVRRAGAELDDIELLVLTHRHIDHFGLGREVRERSGCEVVASRVDAPFMARWEGMILESREQFRRSGRALGIPDDLFQMNERWVRAITAAAQPVESSRMVGEGDVVRAGGRDYRVIETPGHTEGLITLFSEADGIYLANDHVLGHITPNPDVYDYDPDHLRSGLPDYVRSLAKVRDLPATLVLPGHGYEIADLALRVDEILFHHERRARKIVDILKEPRTVFEVVGEVWPSLRPNDAHLAVREIIGHLVLLEGDGAVSHTSEDDILRYRAT